MERVTKWLKMCFGFKKDKPSAPAQKVKKERKENSMISNAGSGKRERRRDTAHIPAEQSKHVIEVAAAKAAIASVTAAIAMLRKRTNLSRIIPLETCAAIKIQCVYCGHLARRARRALKSLVKVQALFRGYLVRKRTAATLAWIHALIRALPIPIPIKIVGWSMLVKWKKASCFQDPEVAEH